MRAQLLTEHGGHDKLKLSEVARPTPSSGQVLVRIYATAVNPVDIKIREGLPIAPPLPAILGADLAGVVEAVGEGVTTFSVGDEVYGCAGGVKGHGGALAEYIAADARLLAPKPKTLSFREAAALPLVSITARDALDRLEIEAGDRVLIHGGTGGVGHIAIQLAKAAGAWVVATVGSDDNAAIARQLGADEVVNYRTEAVGDYVKRLTNGEGFEAIFDTVGGPNLANSFEAAAVEGKIATINARTTADLGLMHSKALSLTAVFMLLPMLRGIGRERHGDILRAIGSDVDAGRLRPLLDDHRFTLETAGEAQELLSSGKARGKVVIDID
ncbi:zinc-dependent alcohol dehydrogenase family protein [Sphingomonadaceae bacterium G21617-S1]|nr:zinc-dependent alcohol dehydrogenase family protein [Sphingomonadaceae bacterium G21617-S1]